MSKSRTREARISRHRRVRQKVNGTTDKPRLCVFRSLNHIYAQVIDDSMGHTLVSASTLDSEIKTSMTGKSKTGHAEMDEEIKCNAQPGIFHRNQRSET